MLAVRNPSSQTAEVPCVSWSGTGVSVEKSADGRIDVDDATFARCCVNRSASCASPHLAAHPLLFTPSAVAWARKC